MDRFQGDPAVQVFIGNILAAGVGLTLTASAHVVFCELDWRPGMVTQAEDRAHRIGQTSSVLVQHLVFEDSIDADMARRIIDKQDVIDRALDVGAAALPAQDDGSEIDRILAGMPAPETDEDRAAKVANAVAAAEKAEKARPASSSASSSASAQEGKPRWQVLEEEREKRWAVLDDEASLMTPEQVEAAHEGLQLLAGMDPDRAREKNEMGFNAPDSFAGHALASRTSLTPRQAAAARKMLRKYKGQLGVDLMARMG